MSPARGAATGNRGTAAIATRETALPRACFMHAPCFRDTALRCALVPTAASLLLIKRTE